LGAKIRYHKDNASVYELCDVDEDRRFTVSREMLAPLGVFSAGNKLVTDTLWAMPTPIGVQILPVSSTAVQRHSEIEALSRKLRWWAAGDKHTAVLRKLNFMLPITCHVHGKKLRCTFASDFERLGLFRGQEDIIVSALGEIVEITRLTALLDATKNVDSRVFSQTLDKLD
jgi:hypothetical protein